MTINEIRTKYLEFFEKNGHTVIPSSAIVPENDATTLFTGSGMQPLLPYFLGEPHPKGTRVVDSQKCFRAEDIEEIGDNRHTTFFEMLGNWSFGDYFKEEQLPWFFEFLTDELGLDPSKLYVTVYEGDASLNIEQDDTSVEVWKKLFKEKNIEAIFAHMGSDDTASERGMQEGERIFAYYGKNNWWSRAGAPENMPAGEPGGPDSEVFYDFGTPHDTNFGPHCHPNCDCGRFLEIGNSVFMEYLKQEDGSFKPLPKKNVDFGGGLERIAAAVNGDPDVFKTNAFQPVIAEIESLSAARYEQGEQTTSFRIVADHLRGAVFMIGAGVLPSNTEAGYILRRIIRRAVRHMDVLGMQEGTLHQLAPIIIEQFGEHYTELQDFKSSIIDAITQEEVRFRETLKKGLREFEKLTSDNQITADDAFVLYTSYGFPVEMTEELAAEKNLTVDTEGFHKLMQEHQDKSRAGAEGKFKGGMGDASEMSVKYHTATHLLNQALRDVLGEHVVQKGSNITPERLRFDFAHGEKMTDEQKNAVEKIVNEKIQAALPVTWHDMSKDEALALGAQHMFNEKYGDTVRVYFIGPEDNPYSLEFCGGPHVENTKELSGTFVIKKEEASSAGVRRIKAVLE